MNQKPKVLISVPNGSAKIHKMVALALLKLQLDSRVNSTIILPTHSPYVNNLHIIIKDFLAGDYDYWITMDDDNPPKRNIIDLVFLEKDVIGCPTPVWHNAKPGDFPVYWNAMDWDDKEKGYRPHQECSGLQEVDAVGSGCMVISRRVLQGLFDRQPFMRQWSDRGIVEIGGDFSFCQKAKSAGYQIYAHYGYPCMHFNEIEIGEIVLAFQDIKK
jgi:hypothetical protein